MAVWYPAELKPINQYATTPKGIAVYAAEAQQHWSKESKKKDWHDEEQSEALWECRGRAQAFQAILEHLAGTHLYQEALEAVVRMEPQGAPAGWRQY